MTFYWIYEVPIFLTFAIIAGAFTLYGVIGLRIIKKVFHKKLGYDAGRNDQVTSFMSVLVVSYGITLGLVAVSTWENLSQVQEKVSKEASALAALYRDISSFPEPNKSALQGLLKKYTRYTIDQAWPQQRQGIVPEPGVAMIIEFQDTLYAFQPSGKNQEFLFGETLRTYNDYVNMRRMRLLSIDGGLPPIIWVATVLGGLLTISFLWFFVMQEFWLQSLLTTLVSFSIGVMIFLIAIMDHPFRGKISVSPDGFEMVYGHFMKDAN